ncbi:hypothetical protein GCM10025857_25940 [Alicyclobacillus contaminans]|nr:hypothetical protein GCM10025857_25940 [Alicyclobacillus contaminans]
MFVPSANAGGSPLNNSAGNEMRPPPPTVESTNDAINPEMKRNDNMPTVR